MNWERPKVYAVKHKDEATRAASRSGGIFTALSDLVLSNGGVVYGCVLTDKFDPYIFALIMRKIAMSNHGASTAACSRADGHGTMPIRFVADHAFMSTRSRSRSSEMEDDTRFQRTGKLTRVHARGNRMTAAILSG